MEKKTTSGDVEGKLQETSMDSGWVEIMDFSSADSAKDSSAAGSSYDSILTCDICHVSFSSLAPYEQHLIGDKHQKRVTKEAMKKKYGAKYLEVLSGEHPGDEPTDDASEDDDTLVIRCETCNKICTGLISYKLHMKGKVHLKEVRKQKVIEKIKGNHELRMETESEDSVYDDIPQVKPFAHCELCNKKFSGPESYQDHMSSGVHKRKVGMESLTKKLTGEPAISGKGGYVSPSADVECFVKCEVCKTSFTGPVPYQVHMISEKHKKKMKYVEVNEKMKSLSLNDEVGNFHCRDCDRFFYVPEEFEQHLNSSAHTKRKMKQKMMKKLQDEYPEMEVQVETNNPVDLKDDDYLLEESTILICTVCNKCFSGPEPASAHFVSLNHKKAKKHYLSVQQRRQEAKKEDPQ